MKTYLLIEVNRYDIARSVIRTVDQAYLTSYIQIEKMTVKNISGNGGWSGADSQDRSWLWKELP